MENKLVHYSSDNSNTPQHLYIELIPLLSKASSKISIVPRLPWFPHDNTKVSWLEQEITAWVLSTKVNQSTIILKCYFVFQEVFNKINTCAPPLPRTYDQALDVLSNRIPNRSHIYPLTLTENKAMEGYISGFLTQGCNLPFTSPSSMGFAKGKDFAVQFAKELLSSVWAHECLVMGYGLVSAPSLFPTLLNDIKGYC